VVVRGGRLGALAVAVWVAWSLAAAVPARGQAAPDPQLRQTIEQVIREYLREHPEVVAEAIQALQARQRAQQRDRARAAVGTHRTELLDGDAPVGGNTDGSVTVVEFFDYRCGYCKSVMPTVKKLLQEDTTVRLVYKELPILGPDSLTASKAALAARAQGKYEAFHAALMSAPQPVTEAQVFEIAARTGLDVPKLRADMEAPAVRAAIDRNYRLAQALGITGTPTFVIGSELAVGAVDLATLRQLVDKARTP
jgi:protein-disulfide isomerase